MPAPSETIELLRSGPFVLDRERLRLTREGVLVALGGQPLLILAILLASPGRVVTRVELMHALWPGQGRIDTGRRLNTAMRALREALGDGAEAPEFIETIRGRGYRWINSEQVAAPRPRWLRANAPVASILSLFGAMLLGSAHPAPQGIATAQRERFVQIAAMADQDAAAASRALDGLISERPHYRAARLLRAELAVSRWRDEPGDSHLVQANAALRAAQRVVGDDADLETLRGELSLGDWDWAAAERHYRRAIALDENHVGARKGLAWLLLNAGREAEAFAELEPLLARADMNDSLGADLGWLLLRMQRADLAARMCGSASAHRNLLACRHTALARLGHFSDARDAALALMQAVDADAAAVASVRGVPPEEGYRRFLAWRTRGFLPAGGSAFQQAQLEAEAGQLDAALASLERAHTAHEPGMVKLWTTREFAPLRSSARFVALWRSVGPG